MNNSQEANMVICNSCDQEYDYADEPAEVKQGGTHICPDCWGHDDDSSN